MYKKFITESSNYHHHNLYASQGLGYKFMMRSSKYIGFNQFDLLPCPYSRSNYFRNILTLFNGTIFSLSEKSFRLVFSRFLDLPGNLGTVKEKPTRKTCFSREKKRLAPRSTKSTEVNGISIIFSREIDYKKCVSI